MKVVHNNHIAFHPHHIISQSHQVVGDCKRETNTDHNTDDREVGVPASTHDVNQCTHPNTTQSTHILTPTQVTPSRFELGREVTKVLNGRLFRGHIE